MNQILGRWAGMALPLAGAMVFGVLPASPAVAAVGIVNNGTLVDGKTIGEWTGRWWTWAMSIGATDNPFTSGTQAAADNGQSGPVYFLAGTLGDTAVRSFEVPANKYLLVPLLNWMYSMPFDGASLNEVWSLAHGVVPLVTSLNATLDGQSVGIGPHFQVTPGTFNFVPASGNVFGYVPGRAEEGVAAGYWLMLKPLTPGSHSLSYGGEAASLGFSTQVTAHVTAVPEPASYALLCGGLAGLLAWCQRRARSA